MNLLHVLVRNYLHSKQFSTKSIINSNEIAAKYLINLHFVTVLHFIIFMSGTSTTTLKYTDLCILSIYRSTSHDFIVLYYRTINAEDNGKCNQIDTQIPIGNNCCKLHFNRATIPLSYMYQCIIDKNIRVYHEYQLSSNTNENESKKYQED